MAGGVLADRAREVEGWIEQHMVDSNGVVYTFVDRTTGALLDAATLEANDPMQMHTGTTAGWWAYENCGMVTGAYLEAMLCRYEVDGDIQAMRRARRCFEAICYIYEIGEQLEEGFIPKIYDNKFSTQTSSDQILYVIGALDHYHRHATKSEKQVVSKMIANIVRFWVNRDYKFTYFALKDMQWPLGRFPANLLMAYRHSGEDVFKKEYERLLAMGVARHPADEQLRPRLAGEREPSNVEREEGGWILHNTFNTCPMDLMELQYLLREDPQNSWAKQWKRSSVQAWDEGVMAVSDDGYSYGVVVVDFETGEVRRCKSRYYDLKGWDWYPYMTWLNGAKSGQSTLLARAGLQILPHLPRHLSIRPIVRRIVSSLKLRNMTYFSEPETFCEKFRYRTNVMSGDVVTNWLWAYWLGLGAGVFSADE